MNKDPDVYTRALKGRPKHYTMVDSNTHRVSKNQRNEQFYKRKQTVFEGSA